MSGSTVVSVGLGLLLDRVGQSGMVHGFEISTTMIDGAQRRFRREIQTRRLSLTAAPMESLPVPDASIDALISTNTIYFIDSPHSVSSIGFSPATAAPFSASQIRMLCERCRSPSTGFRSGNSMRLSTNSSEPACMSRNGSAPAVSTFPIGCSSHASPVSGSGFSMAPLPECA